jgi:hypothetical protein
MRKPNIGTSRFKYWVFVRAAGGDSVFQTYTVECRKVLFLPKIFFNCLQQYFGRFDAMASLAARATATSNFKKTRVLFAST